MASEGLWLEIILIIIIIIAGVIIMAGFITPFITSTGALNFGFKCYSSITGFYIINNYLYPISEFASLFTQTPVLSPISGIQIEGACEQQSNINAYNTASIATQIYAKASSCFSLFSTASGKSAQQILSSKGINQVFTCFTGRIISSNTNSTITNFTSLIKYIDKNYYYKSNPLEIVFLTNSSNGNANLPDLSNNNPDINITNASTYSIAYFQFPVYNPPTSCEVTYAARLTYLSNGDHDQYNSSYEPVNVLSEWMSNSGSDQQSQVGQPCIENYTVPFCGTLLNFMVMNQQIVFICITTK